MRITSLISQREISKRIDIIAENINKDFKNKDLVIVSILTGSIVFCSDIIKKLNIDFVLDFIRVSSYIGKQSTNEVKIIAPTKYSVKDKDILLIDDICDTGQTLEYVKNLFLKEQAKSVKVCVLVNKSITKRKKVDVDYIGFNIEDKFIVGYGLDCDEKYRGLSYIGILEE